MNIVILGAGTIGSYLASILSQEEHNVILIDKDALLLEKIGREKDLSTMCALGVQWQVLEDLIENDPALFIAMTGDDETNLVACCIAKNLGYPQTVARVKEISFLARSRLDFGRIFNVDYFISAEMLAAHDILKNIIHPEDLAIENFAHGAIQMRTIKITDAWDKADIPLCKLNMPENLIVSLIRREVVDIKGENHETIIFPHGGDHIQVGDEITIVGETKAMFALHQYFMTEAKKIGSVAIIGGSAVGARLAQTLEKMNIHVKVVEKDEKRCEELSRLLLSSDIINHDGSDLDFLSAKIASHTDAFAACTSRDDQNFMISLLGKQAGAKKVITLISDINLGPVLREHGILCSVSEKVNIANRILSLIHAESVLSVASLCDNKAKVLEVKVSPNSELVGLPIAELSERLPPKLLIAAIENRGKIMIGKGNKIISPHDTIILITSPEHLHELHNLF